MPDDYIDRVGGWSEASKVAAKFAIYLLRRANRPTHAHPQRKNIYYLLGDLVPWYRFTGATANSPYIPVSATRVISPAWIFEGSDFPEKLRSNKLPKLISMHEYAYIKQERSTHRRFLFKSVLVRSRLVWEISVSDVSDVSDVTIEC